MKTVGIRELKQNASAVVAQVAAGEPVRITSRGQAVAQIVPLSGSPLAGMVKSGRARLARRKISSLAPPLTRRPGASVLSEVLAEMRDSEPY